jgi:hypothetical protein
MHTFILNHMCDGFPVSGAWGRDTLEQHATLQESSGLSNMCQMEGRERGIKSNMDLDLRFSWKVLQRLVSSGMRRHVFWYVFIKVSEENCASIFRAEYFSEKLENMYKITHRRILRG